jgi:predicted DNA-binding transcriptional regulator YafY
MARNRQLVRILGLVRALREGRRELHELAVIGGVTTRTIRRDLDVISCSGIPIRNTTEGRGPGFVGLWWIPREWNL